MISFVASFTGTVPKSLERRQDELESSGKCKTIQTTDLRQVIQKIRRGLLSLSDKAPAN